MSPECNNQVVAEGNAHRMYCKRLKTIKEMRSSTVNHLSMEPGNYLAELQFMKVVRVPQMEKLVGNFERMDDVLSFGVICHGLTHHAYLPRYLGRYRVSD
ncbi:hypothetical protein J3458_022494 [Metarhizium acridum]|uniref:uncharacterized protein n=1 Tax=Metarhizium acridum TaxID=92637 RepID=UPI001C6CF775|nr:hypothetical protein J3458_022494 [Metarhizium acridum]